MQVGTIKALCGNPMSGLWILIFEEGESAFIESGYGVRQLAAAFDAHEGSGDLLECIKGKRINYDTDELGILECFEVVE